MTSPVEPPPRTPQPADNPPVPRTLDGQPVGGQQALPLDITVSRHELHMGPLPPASELGAYDQVTPGLAERIVRMAEQEQQHRHKMETTETQEPFRLARRGQVIALTTVVLVLAFGVFLVVNESPVAGALIVGLDLLGLVAVFVTGQWPTRSSEPAPGTDADEPEAEQPQ